MFSLLTYYRDLPGFTHPLTRAVVASSASCWRRLLVGLTLSLSLLGLSGCQKKPLDWQTGQPASLASMQHWNLKARVALTTPEESVSATLDWQKQADDFDFHIYGLFGATYAHLIQTGHSASLQIPDEPTFYHQNAEQLLYQTLGWDFPMDALSYWIKGLPSGKSGEKIVRGQNQQITQIIFRDWRVDISKYADFEGFILPRMLKAQHPQLSLKVVVKDWEFVDAPAAGVATSELASQQAAPKAGQ